MPAGALGCSIKPVLLDHHHAQGPARVRAPMTMPTRPLAISARTSSVPAVIERSANSVFFAPP